MPTGRSRPAPAPSIRGPGCSRSFATRPSTRLAPPGRRTRSRSVGTAPPIRPSCHCGAERVDRLADGAVHGLPARQRDALVGHAFEGRSYREIAARQQTTIAAVKSLLTRARRTLSTGRLVSGDRARRSAGRGACAEDAARPWPAGGQGRRREMAGRRAGAGGARRDRDDRGPDGRPRGKPRLSCSPRRVRLGRATRASTRPACKRRPHGTARRAGTRANGKLVAKLAMLWPANACAGACTDTMARPHSRPPPAICRPSRSSTPNATGSSYPLRAARSRAPATAPPLLAGSPRRRSG